MIRNFINDRSGAVAAFMIGGFVLMLIAVGVGIDYEQSISGKRAIKDIVESAALAGGIECRKAHLEAKADPNNLPTSVKNQAQAAAEKKLPSSGTREGRSVIKGKPTYTITHEAATGELPQRCRVKIDYETENFNLISGFVGMSKYHSKGTSIVDANLDNIVFLEIDFLVDVSGSMSTITNPSDYANIMNMTQSSETADVSHRGGCIFLCHSRRALLSKPASHRLISAYPNIRQFMYNGDRYVMLDDALQAAKIRLKSNDVFDSVTAMMGIIQSRLRSKASVAFHKFHATLETFIPSPGADSSGLLFSQLPITLNFEDFDYLIPNDGTGESVPSFFPWPAQSGLAVFGDPKASVTTTPTHCPPPPTPLPPGTSPPPCPAPTATYPNSVQYSVVQSLDRNVTGNHSPETKLPDVLKEMLDKIKKRKPPKRNVRRVLVIVTDGVTTPNTLQVSQGEAIPLNACTPIKEQGVITMAVHTYYRFQNGNVASNELKGKLGGQSLSEDAINSGMLHDRLADCASPKMDSSEFPKNEKSYYFKASNNTELQNAFLDLIKVFESLPSTEPPVRVVE